MTGHENKKRRQNNFLERATNRKMAMRSQDFENRDRRVKKTISTAI